MIKYLAFVVTVFSFFIQPHSYGQMKSISVNCGKQIKQEFGAGNEKTEIKIKLNAGDKLSIKVIPTGDYLNIRAEVYDPSKGRIYPDNPSRYTEPMFINHARTLEITTGMLSATGIYSIMLYNNYKVYRKDARAGEYTFVTTCSSE